MIVEVVDHEGLAVSSAEVEASGEGLSGRTTCLTSSDGSCSLGRLPVVKELWIGVGHREYEYYSEWLDLTRNGPRVLLRLPERPWRLLRGAGRVLDEEGDPVEGASVTLTEMMEHLADSWTAVTDPAGGFTVERLPEGAYYVTVEAEGYASALASMWAGDGAPPLAVQLVRGTSVRGTATALLETGCRHARVWASQVSEENNFEVAIPWFRGPGPIRAEGGVDENCGYLLPHLGPGYWKLGVLNHGNPVWVRGGPVEISPGQTDVVFDLEPDESKETKHETALSTVRGIVIDRYTGEGLEGAEVSVGWGHENDGGGYAKRWSTDREGEFTLSISLPAATVGLTASMDGYTTERVPWGGIEETVRIELSPTEGLHYRVRWFDGVDPESIKLNLIDEAGRRLEHGWGFRSEGHWPSAPVGEFILEASGGVFVVQVPVVIPGPRMNVVIPPMGGAKLRVPELEAEFGPGWLDGVQVEARPLGEIDGIPVIRAEEELYLNGLAAGPWEITMTAPDGRAWTGRAEIQTRRFTEVFLR